MSAIVERAPYANRQLDGMRRYHTRIKVIVHSHNSTDPLDISDDINSCNLSKNIKGVGRANLSVVPRLNLLNLVHPNDVINIYFNRGDGQGWTRAFFGYVDRIEEEYTVDSGTGMPTSLYHIISSDWTKALQKTEVYFNPAFAGRRDISADITGDGGAKFANFFKGLSLKGSPADMVLDLILLQLGFAGQWVLPNSYRATRDERFVRLRREYAESKLLSTMKRSLSPEQQQRLERLIKSGELESIRQSNDQPLTPQDTSTLSTEEQASSAIQGAAGESEVTTEPSADNFSSLTQADAFRAEVVERLGGGGSGSDRLRAYFNQLSDEGGENQRSLSLLDIVNLFDFVEHRAMDGWWQDASVWESQGPLLNIIKSVSNEVINELIFDLRPVSAGGDLIEGTDWDRSPDEIGGNLDENDGERAGIRYVPSVIMREYPFSTISAVDASGVALARSDSIPGDFGQLYFGAIFSNRPNQPGRHLIWGPVLEVAARANGDSGLCTKHLDVAVISETEIQQSRFGRSDNDHFNLFEMYSDSGLGQSERYLLKDFVPIITPIHIARHGLRVRSVATRFCRFDISTANVQRNAPSAEEQEENAPAAEDEDAEHTFSQDVVPPVVFPTGAEYAAGTGYKLTFRNAGAAKWGYRPTTRGGPEFWHFHNGNDYGFAQVSPRRAGDPGIVDVVAIADGYVVASIPNGGFSSYGTYVAIHHPQFEGPDGLPIISVYAHLDSRTDKVGNSRNGGSKSKVDGIAKGWHHSSRRSSNFEKIYIKKGEVIGKMGKTGMQRSNTHLHFEISTKIPSKARGSRDVATDEANYLLRKAAIIARPNVSADKVDFYLDPTLRQPYASGPPPTTGAVGSIDPVEFFNTYPSTPFDIQARISALNPDSSEEETVLVGEEGGGEDPSTPEDEAPAEASEDVPTDDTPTQTGEPQGSVDTPSTRKQLGRWVIMQDHWYQHNVEYLNGQLVMRGAPEIRVGMRLDILERNLSFYVEAANHNWSFSNIMTTTLQLTRGQPNNPYPSYALPPTEGFNSRQTSRQRESRLAHFAVVPDPIAVRRAISLRKNAPDTNTVLDPDFGDINELDVEDNWATNGGTVNFGELPGGLLPAESTARPDTELSVLEDAPSVEEALETYDEFIRKDEEERTRTETLNNSVAEDTELPRGGSTS